MGDHNWEKLSYLPKVTQLIGNIQIQALQLRVYSFSNTFNCLSIRKKVQALPTKVELSGIHLCQG